MRAATRLLASVKTSRFLEPGNPTGLTGLFTHPSPRSTLIALYSETLDKLETFPEHSVYRQSAEAITRHRMKIVEAVKPEGYEAWSERARKRIEAYPEFFPAQKNSNAGMSVYDGRIAMMTDPSAETDDREIEWDGERMVATAEGVRTEDEKAYQGLLGRDKPSLRTNDKVAAWEPEPPLEAMQYVQSCGEAYSCETANELQN